MYHIGEEPLQLMSGLLHAESGLQQIYERERERERGGVCGGGGGGRSEAASLPKHVADRFYIALFSALQQTHCAYE